jgi:hypothetical protein
MVQGFAIGSASERGIVACKREKRSIKDPPVQIELNLRQNALTIEIGDDAVMTRTTIPGIIDIGERGRLLSLELFPGSGNAIVVPLEDRTDPLARSAEILVECGIAANGEIVTVQIPRRGPDYEISFPSGNQCWIGANGAVNCSVISDDARPEGWRSGGE